ncbi:MAG TPA: glycosyltransferase family 4 protein [Candidatus Hydrogenedentes bacterium]|nr:glycosyltransferase family 4 protein [Candidatus Hydrogenedentota bacterium]
MRLAVVDLLFCWPPHGGADVHLYHVMRGLQAMGQDVRLFVTADASSWERGAFNPDALPFPATRLDFSARTFTRRRVCKRVREAVDAWAADAVIVADGFFLKPWVCDALSDYPLVAQYYAYEAVCHRDILRFKDGAPCPNHFLYTPDACRACALARLAPDIRSGLKGAWLQEYLAARAYAPEYHAMAAQSLARLDAAIVFNRNMRDALSGFCPTVFLAPGGVALEAFPYSPPAPESAVKPKTVLMPGRAEDAAKGLAVFQAAGEVLWRERRDFVLHATVPEDTPATEWFRPLPWREHRDVARLYAEADIVVVPSLWDEPFGLVAVEAMAVGRPVCASRVGGLQDIVAHLDTGFLFDRGDARELAKQLAVLLDNPDLRRRMGEAGRRRVETEYAWDRVLARHFTPILAFLAACEKG